MEVTLADFAKRYSDPEWRAARIAEAPSWVATRLTIEHCGQTGASFRLSAVTNAEAPAVAMAAAVARAWGFQVYAATDPGGSAPSARFIPAALAARIPWRALHPTEVVHRLWEFAPMPHQMTRQRFAHIMVGVGAVPVDIIEEFARAL